MLKIWDRSKLLLKRNITIKWHTNEAVVKDQGQDYKKSEILRLFHKKPKL